MNKNQAINEICSVDVLRVNDLFDKVCQVLLRVYLSHVLRRQHPAANQPQAVCLNTDVWVWRSPMARI